MKATSCGRDCGINGVGAGDVVALSPSLPNERAQVDSANNECEQEPWYEAGPEFGEPCASTSPTCPANSSQE